MQSNYAKVRVCSFTNRTKCDLQLEPGNFGTQAMCRDRCFIFSLFLFCVSEITEILLKSEDPEELKYYWTQWYDKAGTPVRSLFDKYVELNKEAAVLNSECIGSCGVWIVHFLDFAFFLRPDFTSGAEMWLSEYEDSTFEQQLENIFEEIRPLYQQLHAYVRHALRTKYGDLVSETGPLPMHLLGNMWAQSWESVRTHHYSRFAYQSIRVFSFADR